MVISPAQAFVIGANEPLVNLYAQLRTAVDSVIEKVNEMDARPVESAGTDSPRGAA